MSQPRVPAEREKALFFIELQLVMATFVEAARPVVHGLFTFRPEIARRAMQGLVSGNGPVGQRGKAPVFATIGDSDRCCE